MEKKFIDVTAEYQRMQSQLLLIRHILGINPVHDVVDAVRTLHDEGKVAFERKRGDHCAYATQWRP